MSAIKKSIVFVKAAFYCLAHALFLAMARVNGDPKYNSYRIGRRMKQPVEDLLNASAVKLCNSGSFKNLQQLQEYLSDYKIIVFNGLSPDRFMFS